MVSIFKVGRLFKAVVLLGIGYGLGFFFGSALPSPGYIPYLSSMPLGINSPTDVSDHVAGYLPVEPLKAFDVVAASSSSVWTSYDPDCACSYFFFQRVVRRLPIPDRELTVWFRVKEGKIEYRGASIVIWFL